MPVAKLVKYGRTQYEAKRHPLYSVWKNMRSQHPCTDDWREFRKFAADVGQRPHKSDLRRIDPDKPFGSDNFYWKRRVSA